MSTTETQTPLPGETAQAAAEQLQDVAAAAAPAEPSKSEREYILFEEARAETWTKLGAVEAGSQEAALETLGQQKLQSGQRFMAIPSRFVRPVKPKITTQTTITFD